MDTATARKISKAKGKFFFSKGAMEFFNSRIEGSWTETTPGVYRFITSEKFDDESPRLYTIREFNENTADVDTIGEFQAYDTIEGARAFMLA